MDRMLPSAFAAYSDTYNKNPNIWTQRTFNFNNIYHSAFLDLYEEAVSKGNTRYDAYPPGPQTPLKLGFQI